MTTDFRINEVFKAKYGSPKMQEQMSDHPHAMIRSMVASSGSDAIRDKALKDKSPHVVAAALSRGTKEQLDAHISHPSVVVRSAVAEHGNAGHQSRLMRDPDSAVRQKVAQHSNDSYIHDHLVNDEDHFVRASLASNPHTDERTLERLKDDDHGYVRRHAKQEYERRNPNEWHAW